jgi:hypothetical protein
MGTTTGAAGTGAAPLLLTTPELHKLKHEASWVSLRKYHFCSFPWIKQGNHTKVATLFNSKSSSVRGIYVKLSS